MTEKRNYFKFQDGKPVEAIVYNNDKRIDKKLICGDCDFFDRQLPPINDIGYCQINGVGHKEDFECVWQDDYQKNKSAFKK